MTAKEQVQYNNIKTEQEIWKDISSYEGRYQVSNYGRIKSIGIKRTGKSGTEYVNQPRILKPFINTHRRTTIITLTKENKEHKNYFVNRIVAESFLDNPENKPIIKHKNGDTNDNRAENLEWVSSEDIIESFNHDLGMEGEVWKDVREYEGRYQVSNYGRVKSYGFNKTTSSGGNYITKPQLLKSWINTLGYVKVGLTIKTGAKSKHYSVHRLVGEAFIDNPDNKPQINHKNGIRHDNRVENLEWSTASENVQHSFDVLRRVFTRNNNGRVGKLHHSSIKIDCYDSEGNFIKTFYGVAEASRELSITQHKIYSCLKAKYKYAENLNFKYHPNETQEDNTNEMLIPQ